MVLEKVGREDETFKETFNITDVMEGWSTQPGYPVITVTGKSFFGRIPTAAI